MASDKVKPAEYLPVQSVDLHRNDNNSDIRRLLEEFNLIGDINARREGIRRAIRSNEYGLSNEAFENAINTDGINFRNHGTESTQRDPQEVLRQIAHEVDFTNIPEEYFKRLLRNDRPFGTSENIEESAGTIKRTQVEISDMVVANISFFQLHGSEKPVVKVRLSNKRGVTVEPVDFEFEEVEPEVPSTIYDGIDVGIILGLDLIRRRLSTRVRNFFRRRR